MSDKAAFSLTAAIALSAVVYFLTHRPIVAGGESGGNVEVVIDNAALADWSREHGHGTLPASPGTVAAFLQAVSPPATP